MLRRVLHTPAVSSGLPPAAAVVTAAALPPSRRHASRIPPSGRPAKKVGVIGLGFMGRGILAQVAHAGYNTVGVDHSPDVVRKAMPNLELYLIQTVGRAEQLHGVPDADSTRRRQETLTRVQVSGDLGAISDCDFVIEATKEVYEPKRQVFADISSLVGPDAVLATNTNSFPISEMAKAANRPKSVVGLHFFAPVVSSPCVEVVHTETTDMNSLRRAEDFVRSLGKKVVHAKDTPGFLVNRVLLPYLLAAMRMYDRGTSNPRDIDRAVRHGMGHPRGPFEQADYIGLDLIHRTLTEWMDGSAGFLPEGNWTIPNCLNDLVAQGKFGRSTGEGFHKWVGDNVASE